MRYGFCFLGVVPVRKEPKSSSEQITQLLFGDSVVIVDEYEGENKFSDCWLKIINIYDDYEGWIDKRNIMETAQPQERNYMVSSPFAKIRMNNEIVIIPIAASLPDKSFVLNDVRFTLIEGNVIYKTNLSPFLINAISLLYLNSPYQWGGKNILGLDCSGFVQNVFAFADIKLKRDASQQVLQGKEVSFSNIKSGNLCFFCNSQKNINHVGIYIGENKIIHCSGRVRIDNINEKGIVPLDRENEYSHTLCNIKSYF